MELENLKTQLSSASTSQLSKATLLEMMKTSSHPALKRIRMQVILESVAWTLFLAMYYNFFDGHEKSIIWNIALVAAILLLLIHNLLIYKVTDHPINGENIKDSLRGYSQRLKQYSIISVTTRVVAIVILIGFFLSSIEIFEQRHFIAMIGAGVIIIIQAFILWRIWQKRIKSISAKYDQLLT